MFAYCPSCSQEVIAVIEITSIIGRADLKMSLSENVKLKSMLDISSPDEPDMATFLAPMVMAMMSMLKNKK